MKIKVAYYYMQVILKTQKNPNHANSFLKCMQDVFLYQLFSLKPSDATKYIYLTNEF